MNIEKFTMKTPDGIHANVEALKRLFPEIVSEGKVDFEQLKTILGGEIADDERYQFTWAGKREAMLEASTPTTKTLRPCVEESKDWENTKNLYIEGDNLEALKILQNTYGGKVKMIYIDPPYNTGHDFIYHDNFHGTRKDEFEKEGSVGEEGEWLRGFKMNSESNGRFHSDWCSMMYPRLKLARNLLRDDGVLFMSIDDNEVINARKLCDEVFGEGNFVAQIIVDATPKNDPYVVSTAHEYVLVYCKQFIEVKKVEYGIHNPYYDELIKIYNAGKGDFEKVKNDIKAFFKRENLTDDNISNYKFVDERGVFRTGPLDDPQSSGPKDERINPNTGKPCAIPSRGWGCSIETWKQWVAKGEIMFSDDDDKLPSRKVYISPDRLDVMRAYFKMQTRKDTDALKNLFGLKTTPFSNPKPVELIRTFIENCNDKEMIVFDFFSGSATTAHAVMRLNAQDGGNRKFILVQLPECINEHSGQSNKEKKIVKSARDFLQDHALPINICEIGKERIRRAGEKIKEELAAKDAKSGDLDIGFRVFKVDSSNMDDIYFQPMNVQQQDLIRAINNVKTDRTALDLLFGCLLEWGLPIDLPVKERKDLGSNTFEVDNGRIIAAFDSNITESTVRSIANEQPDFAIFRDQCFYDSASKINVREIFKTLSPNTKLKVL